MDEIRGRIKSFIVDNFLFGETGSLADNTSFLEEGIVDSTGILELVNFLEEEFGVVIRDEELVPENLDSVEQVVAFMLRKQGFLELELPSMMQAGI